MHLHIIRGLPGSGKSTIARAWAARGYVHLETDDYFVVGKVYQYDRARVRDAHAWCRAQLAAALAAGRDVVVANTFSRRWEMSAYLDVAADYDATVTEETATGARPSSSAAISAAMI